MVCASCGRVAKAGARFCGGCGAAFALRCPGCGVECDPDLRFCEACGASLGAPAAARSTGDAAARKVVTIVFADLVGSTALHERLDAEAVRQFMEGYYAAMRGAVEAHGGRVTQVMGDGVKAVFGAPRVAEDDAIRAVRAGVEMQRAFRELAEQQRERVGTTGLRVAVNTGEVVADDATEIIGDPVNVAARLQEQGRDGDVVIGGETQRIVASLVTLERLGSFALKGRSGAVEAYRVVSLEPPAGAATTPFVGRDEELRRLRTVYDAATAAPAARLAVLLGSPGLGKSRLLAELARQLAGRARVLTAQCDPAGGATFAPLAEALRAHLGLEAGAGDEALRAALDGVVSGDAAERVLLAKGIGALLSGTPAMPEEIFFVVRRLLAALAAERPVVLSIDDVQWAEPLLLDFTEHLVQWGAGIPLLVLVAARPELRDTRSSFASAGGLVSDVVTLGGLDAGAATRLAANVVGADTLPAAVAGRVLATSEGNPLFLRELVRMLVNDGTLRRDGERWALAVDLTALEMPPTIQALLAARIERLRPEERLVLERASVVGRQFSRAAVRQLLPSEAQADLDVRLEALRRSELVEADAGWLLGEPALRFHHALIRDAAYRRVLRGTRAELHARFAGWLEGRSGESVDLEETIGWHLEQAYQHLRELGPLDANGRSLGERAGRRLAAAGRRALARDDLTPARSLLGRALDCLAEADPARGDLSLDWCEALLSAGDVATAARALAELGRFIETSPRLRAWHTCFTSQLAALADPKALRSSRDAVVAAAEALAAAGDVAGEAKAHAVHAEALARLGEVGACEAALDKALAAARRAGDRRRANTVLSGAPLAALWGPSPVTRASGRCLDVVRVLRITEGAPAVEAVALRCQAVLETLRGRSEAARRMIASSRRLVEELGITQRLLEVDHSAGLIELFEGDAVAAERLLRPAYEGFRAHGLGVAAAQTAALLGGALVAQGRLSEAEALSHESEALAGDDFQAAIDWRGTRALALAGRGEYAAALELAQAAVEIAAGTDDLLDHAAARNALAVALRAAGRGAEAAAEEARAIELWEKKGATLLVGRARGGAARGAPAERASWERVESRRIERRRVRPNGATAHADRLNAAIAARDAEAVSASTAAGFEAVLHPTGAVLDRQGTLDWWHMFFEEDRDGVFQLEPLASLGSSLALCLQSWTGTASTGPGFEVGPYQRDAFCVIEADAQGRIRQSEVFAPDRLGDAIPRLYERHAELLAEGTDKLRAAATARSVAQVPRAFPSDLDSLAAVLAPDVEFVDHRPLGLPPRRGAKEFLEHQGTLFELANELAVRIDDVVALRPDALLGLWINSGRLRAGGGAFEREFLFLDAFRADGRLARRELFGADRVDQALARFDELTERSTLARSASPRVRQNEAVANVRRFEAALAARAPDRFEELLAEDAVMVEHPMGVEFDREQLLRNWRRFLAAEHLVLAYEPLATLGDSLALLRQALSAGGVTRGSFDVGPYDREELVLVEVDAAGRRRRLETFAIRSPGSAIARLYERYAELLPDGRKRTVAAASARLVTMWNSPIDPERDAAAVAPTVEVVDHRILGSYSGQGASTFLAQQRSWSAVAEGVTRRLEAVLALRADALLGRFTHTGIDRTSGGAYERPFLLLWTLGVDGLATHWEFFDPEREADALARFDELAHEAAPPAVARRVRPNRATAVAARIDEAIAAQDADAIQALLSDEAGATDHTLHTTWDRQAVLASSRALALAEGPSSRSEALATLGDSLALFRVSLTARRLARGAFDVGGYEKAELHLIDVDSQGRRRWTEFFALEKLGDAIVRLQERYAEGLPEGPERTRASAIARSFESLLRESPERAPFAPDAEAWDHRTVGFGSLRGADAIAGAIRGLRELSDDVEERFDDVLAMRPDALLARWTTSGTIRASGGGFEQDLCQLFVFGADGLLARWEQFDGAQEAEAFARFEELTASPRRPGIPNGATRWFDRLGAAWDARDWAAVRALAAEGARFEDRSRHVLVSGDADSWLGELRRLAEAEGGSLHCQPTPVAAVGDRVCLARVSWTRGPADGRVAIGSLWLAEFDASGRLVACVTFGANAWRGAIRELIDRWRRHDAAAAAVLELGLEVLEAWNDRDRSRLRAVFADDFVFHDHRLVGQGRVDGVEATLEHQAVMWDLAPDIQFELCFVAAVEPHGAVVGTRSFGTLSDGGGSFERDHVQLMIVAHGRIPRLELFDPDQADTALARLAELRPDPLHIPPNTATRAAVRWHEAVAAGDFEAVEAFFAPTLVFDDRTRRSLLRGDRELLLANDRLIAASNPHSSITVLATAGDRLALQHVTMTGSADGTPFEIDFLQIVEVDGDGRLVAAIAFDPDERRAASNELFERYASSDAGRWMPRNAVAFRRALHDRDLEGIRAALSDDFVFDDHRRTGMGRLEGVDRYVAGLAAQYELAADTSFEPLYYVAAEEHGYVAMFRMFGTHVEGSEFEGFFVRLELYRGDRVVAAEAFEPEELELARARFEELRPDPTRIRPNAASRAAERISELHDARDWEALRTLTAADFRFDDRQKRALVAGGVELWLRNLEFVSHPGRTTRELIGTVGDRIAIQHVAFAGEAEGGAFDAELLVLTELAADGRLLARISFDPEDRATAFAEAQARFVAGEAAAIGGQAPLLALGVAIDRGDWEAARGSLGPDAVVHDRRPLSFGELSGDRWVEALRVQRELAPDVQAEQLQILAWNRRGRAYVVRRFGTLREGGPFENFFLVVAATEGNCIPRYEIFDVADMDRALARFEELCADPV